MNAAVAQRNRGLSPMAKDLEKLIQKCLKKDQRAQRELYELCFDRLMQTCARFHRNREDAVALLNDGFLKILLQLKKYNGNEDFYPWISTIMVRTAIDQYRRSRNYKMTIELQEDICIGEADYWVENEVIENMEQAEVNRILHRLPENEKMVFNLFEMEGHAHAEVAGLLNISVRSSKRYLNSAKVKLRAMLEKKTAIKKVV